MKVYKQGTEEYKQPTALMRIYGISRTTVWRLLNEMQAIPKYKKSFLSLSPKLKIVRLADFQAFLEEKSCTIFRQ